MTIKYDVSDYIGLDGVTYRVNVNIDLPQRFKHRDIFKRSEIRRQIIKRLSVEIDFSEIGRALELIISEEANK